jgi:hypothetical protein
VKPRYCRQTSIVGVHVLPADAPHAVTVFGSRAAKITS